MIRKSQLSFTFNNALEKWGNSLFDENVRNNDNEGDIGYGRSKKKQSQKPRRETPSMKKL